MIYPLFVPPKQLFRSRMTWTKKEAESYRDWIVESSVHRIWYLLDFLEEPEIQEAGKHLLVLGNKTAYLLNEIFSIEGKNGKELTPQGYAIAADLGLVVAHYLIRDSHQIQWAVLRGSKLQHSYNLPVLNGFLFGFLDPIGGSVAEAYGVLRKERDYDAWERMYTFWSNRIPC